jgi:hypothetical protein
VCTDKGAAAEEKYLEFSEDISLSGWQEMTRFIAAVQAAEGPGQFDWESLGVLPMYGVMHYPFPHIVLEQGDGPWHDPLIPDILNSRRFQGDQGLAYRRQMMRSRRGVQTDLPGESYVSLLLFALSDHYRMGGWPYRHEDIYGSKNSRRSLKHFERMENDKVYKDPLIILTAEVICSGLSGQMDKLTTKLAELHQQSPYLAAWADMMLSTGLEHHNRHEWLRKYRSARQQVFPWDSVHLHGIIKHLQESGLISYPSHLDFSRYERWYTRYVGYRTPIILHFSGLGYLRPVAEELRQMVWPVNEALWQLSTHEQLQAPAQALYAADMVQSLGRKNLNAAVTDSVAAAHRLNDHYWLALRYQRQAVRRARNGSNQEEEFEQKVAKDLRAWEQSLAGHEQLQAVPPAPPVWQGADQSGFFEASGPVLDGAPIGRWTFALAGQTVGSGFFAEGVAHGWWQFGDDAGVIRAAGFIHTPKMLVPMFPWGSGRISGPMVRSWRAAAGSIGVPSGIGVGMMRRGIWWRRCVLMRTPSSS